MSTTPKNATKVGLSDEAKAAAASKTGKPADAVKPEHVITAQPVGRPSGPVAATVMSAGSLPKGMTSDKLEAAAVPAKQQRADHRAAKKAAGSRKAPTARKASTPRTPAAKKATTSKASTPAKAAPAKVTAPARKAAPAGTNPVSGTARLSAGALAPLVLKHLEANATEALSPSAIGKALGRSSGAVAKQLVKLTAAGTIRRTSTKPLQYQAAKATGKGTQAPVAVAS